MPLTPCATIISYVPSTCAVVPGGVARIFMADATLLDFTQASPVSGVPQPYTAITDLGTATNIYPIQFTRMRAKYGYKMKNTDGVSPSYTHALEFDVPDINMLTEQWSTLTDAQGYCCGILLFVVLNSGRILVMGEASVNGDPIAVPFYTYQDGSSADSGAKMDDANTNKVILTGMYNRPLIEYTGGLASLLALLP